MIATHALRACATLTLACTFVLITFSAAFAECGCKHMHGHHPEYADLDADGDGVVTSDEFYAFRAERMSQYAKEGHKMRHAENAPKFEDLDLDGDNVLSAEEFAEHRSMCPAAKQD